jgi:hypothetical protein
VTKKSDSKNFSIDDFTALQPLAIGYELQPGKFYLIVAGPKQFSRNGLNALFDKMRDAGVEFGVHIAETLHPRAIQVMEKKDESANSTDPVKVAERTPQYVNRSEGGAEGVEDDQAPVQRPLGY